MVRWIRIEEAHEGMLPAEIERHRFGVEECHRMAEVGILSQEDRVELIDGELVRMRPIGAGYINCVNRLTTVLVEFSARRYQVSVQNPFRLDDERKFEPDLVLLREHPGETGLSMPAAEDALLVVEVAETSLYRDRNIKLPRYTRTGIPEVWLVDLGAARIELYAGPGVAGSYAIARTYGREETVRSESAPGLALDVEEILGDFAAGER
ncbi:MAG TPA: Uma2 family endonuclease [Rubrobacteraceae bacterium]|nr:Uma2 family endonuclease [Rubrobacteraceae bacterium]